MEYARSMQWLESFNGYMSARTAVALACAKIALGHSPTRGNDTPQAI